VVEKPAPNPENYLKLMEIYILKIAYRKRVAK
jgi:hypothetical protein